MTDTEPPASTDSGRPSMPAGLADEQFAVNIRETRERRGMSQGGLAEEMRKRGWEAWYPQTVQKVEAGHRHVRVGEAEALARIFGTTMERLTWPGTTASAAVLLDMSIGRAQGAWDRIARETATMLWNLAQLQSTVNQAERSDYLGSADIREIVREAKLVLQMTPEDAVEQGRADHEALRPGGDEEEEAGE
jgi:transcriptional regulator with XRE-family HTH domain